MSKILCTDFDTFIIYIHHLYPVEVDTFLEVPALEYLEFDDVDLDEVTPGMFNGMQNLQELWMDDNEFDSIEPLCFSTLTSLRVYS